VINPLPDALLHALATQPEPLLHPLALPSIDASVWESLEKDGLIRHEKNPKRILLDPDYSVAVRWSGDFCIGVDDSCDPPSTVPLKAEDLIQYKVNLNELLERVCELNRISRKSSEPENGFCLLGRKRFAEGPACSIYFYRPHVFADASLESRLAWLAQSGASHKVVIFPEWPDVDENIFEKHNLWVADLNPNLSVNWPPHIQGSKGEPDLMLVESKKEWIVTFEGVQKPVTKDRGMMHIAWLLGNPSIVFDPFQVENRELPEQNPNDLDKVIEVFGNDGKDEEQMQKLIRKGLAVDSKFDPEERREKFTLIKQYREEIKRAKSSGERALERELRDAQRMLVAELFGLPLPDTSGEDVTQARDRVYRAIRRSFDKLDSDFDAFAKHVRGKLEIKKDFYYNMGPDWRWRVDFL
jgi:hypothetical protein